MSDRKTHQQIGLAAGAVYASYRAKDQNTSNWLLEVAGGAARGYMGGLLPDILEPAISSWHRDVAHSCATGGTIVSALVNMLPEWETACRENAERCRAAATVSTDSAIQLLSALGELFWRFLAGFLHGLASGYVSHLALDAVTPRSIPFITRHSFAM